MKITKDKFRQCVQRYIFETIAPNMNSLSQFLLGASYAQMESTIDERLEAIGIIGEDNMIDMEHIDKLVQHGFRASQGKLEIPVLGMRISFKPEDWNTFKRMI